MAQVASPYTGGTLFKARDLAGTVVLVKTGTSTLYALTIINNQAAAIFVQLFNAKAIADVTLGTTTPDLEFNVAASTNKEVYFTAVGAKFDIGMCIASTTLEKGSVGSAAGVQVFGVYA